MASRSAGANEAVVEAEGLVFSYGDLRVLDGVSLRVPRGEIFGVLGASGSGKSTLIKLIVGALAPQAGALRVFGEPPAPRLTSRMGYMPQLQALYQELSVWENADFFARMYGMSDRKRRRDAVDRILTLVELRDWAKTPVLRLSGGMRQRLSLAIALAHSPPLLILDEPTVGMDPLLRATFWERFRAWAADGVTLIITSHVMDDAAHCDRLGFLRDGRFIAQGTPTALRAAVGRPDATLEDAFLHFVRREEVTP